MPVLGGSDKDGIDIFILQNLPEILFHFGDVAHILLTPGIVLFDNLVIDIAAIQHFSVRILLDGLKMGLRPAMDPDYRTIDMVVCTPYAPVSYTHLTLPTIY